MERFKRWGVPQVYASMDDFLRLQQLPDGPHALPGMIDLHTKLVPGAPLLFFFHGQVGREKVSPPVFQGMRLAGAFSRVSIADPTLYLAPDLRLAWYLGHRDLALQQVLVPVLRRIVEIAQPPRVLFVGGSGGGFASLYFASHFPESTALVWNPQTSVLRYPRRFVEHYSQVAWGTDTPPGSLCVDVGPLYREAGPKVLYLQNSTDNHVQRQMEPFLKDARQEGIITHLGEWGEGHVPPPKAFLRELIRRAAVRPWEDMPRSIRKAQAIAAQEVAEPAEVD